MKIHDLKIQKQFLDDIKSGLKTWELRDTTDRWFDVGDQLFLREWDGKKYTGPSILVNVTYIMRTWYGMQKNTCIMSIIQVEPMSCVELWDTVK